MPNPIKACILKVKQALKKEPKPEEHFIKFLVQDDKGKPVKDVKIKLTLPDGAIEEVSSNAHGQIEIKGIKPGNCTLDLAWDEYAASEIAFLQ